MLDQLIRNITEQREVILRLAEGKFKICKDKNGEEFIGNSNCHKNQWANAVFARVDVDFREHPYKTYLAFTAVHLPLLYTDSINEYKLFKYAFKYVYFRR